MRHRPLGSAYGDDDPRWDLLEACIELAEKSWQGQSSDGTTLSHDCVLPFLRETHGVATRLGMLDMNVLTLGGKPVAFGYNYLCEGSVYGLRAGYDPAYRRLGVGGLLFAKALEDSALRGDCCYDFGPGSLAAKRTWQTRLAPIHHLVHYPTGDPRAQVLRAKHWLDSKTGQEAKKLAAC